MLVIDVLKLFREYLVSCDDVDGKIKESGEEEINLSRITLEVKPGTMQWRTEQQSQSKGDKQHVRQITIKKSDSTTPEAFGQVHTTEDSDNYIRVTIEDGIVRGLNTTLQLPLDTNNKELIKEYGSEVEIYPGKAQSELKKNKMKIGVAIEGPIGAQGATASVSSKHQEYTDSFECTVVLDGLCLVRGIQYKIGQVIQYLQVNQPKGMQSSDDDLTALRVSESNTDKVELTMKGTLACKWGYNQEIDWK